MKKIIVLSLILFIAVQSIPFDASAQCVMCKAAVESNTDSDIGGGLNEGILYLMAIPYIILGTIGICWYRVSKASKKAA